MDLKRNKDLAQLTQNNKVDWKLVLKYFNIKSNFSTNFEQSKIHAFKLHILFKELPTITHLSHKNHGLYKDMKCPTCGIINEDQIHIWQCSRRYNIIDDIKNKFIVQIIEQCSTINKEKIIDQ